MFYSRILPNYLKIGTNIQHSDNIHVVRQIFQYEWAHTHRRSRTRCEKQSRRRHAEGSREDSGKY